MSAELRRRLESSLDSLQMSDFNEGFEAAINAIDELSNILHNQGYRVRAEALRWAAKELKGENID